MKWKLFMRNFSVSAPRMTIRTQLPWPLRATRGALLLALAAVIGLAFYEYGHDLSGPSGRDLAASLDSERVRLVAANSERDHLNAALVSSENQIKVQQAAQEQILRQLKLLEDENSQLKEDLAFFEGLLPMPVAAKGVVIRSFRVQPDGMPNLMRYRLLVQQSGKAERPFNGVVQLIVNMSDAGRADVLTVPSSDAKEDELPLTFRHYQRLEGTFTIPAGAIVRSVQVRIRAGGETQAEQTFSL